MKLTKADERGLAVIRAESDLVADNLNFVPFLISRAFIEVTVGTLQCYLHQIDN